MQAGKIVREIPVRVACRFYSPVCRKRTGIWQIAVVWEQHRTHRLRLGTLINDHRDRAPTVSGQLTEPSARLVSSFLYDGCRTVVERLYSGCIAAVEGLYKSCRTAVERLYNGCITAV